MIVPVTPQNAENWAADFAKAALSLIAQAEQLDQYAQHWFTEKNRQDGVLIQGHHKDSGEAITWTSAQLAESAARYQRIGDFARVLSERDREGRSLTSDLRAFARPERLP